MREILVYLIVAMTLKDFPRDTQLYTCFSAVMNEITCHKTDRIKPALMNYIVLEYTSLDSTISNAVIFTSYNYLIIISDKYIYLNTDIKI